MESVSRKWYVMFWTGEGLVADITCDSDTHCGPGVIGTAGWNAGTVHATDWGYKTVVVFEDNKVTQSWRSRFLKLRPIFKNAYVDVAFKIIF
jgi:hypothetical protein